MYSKIYEFCKVRNIGGVYQNSIDKPTPRVEYLISLLEEEGIHYELDKFESKKGWMGKSTMCYNIILKGSSNKMVVAHHDIVNPNIDNANDNSASVINAIMVKKLIPNINVVLLDGEEVGGLGSKRVSDQINEGYFGDIDWVLNLELTGRGGKYFFIGNYPGTLTEHIKSLFDCPVVQTPYNDSVTFRKNGIDSVVINPLPKLNGDKKSNVKWDDNTYLDYSMLFNCHTEKDTIDTISVYDMKEFVEQVLIKILS
jgi:Iap family predicted aminopeptidase